MNAKEFKERMETLAAEEADSWKRNEEAAKLALTDAQAYRQQQLAECRAKILFNLENRISVVETPFILPDEFLQEMISAGVWLRSPVPSKWDSYSGGGGLGGEWPTPGANVVEFTYTISRVAVI